MPRELRTLDDLPPQEKAAAQREQRRIAERRKHPATLSVPERVTRLEILLDAD